MDEFIEEIKETTTEYGAEVSNLSISLAIECYTSIRNYPSTYTDEKLLEDMKKSKSKIAMASIEIDSKVGVEGQTAHSENGINRSYGEIYIKAYNDVIGFANVN